MFKKMAWAGSALTLSNLPAPKYWEMIAEIALRVWPKIHISMDKNEPTIPAAAKDSIPSWGMLPTMAVSVMDKIGSAMPAMVAGMARLFMVLKFIRVFNKKNYKINS